MAQTQTRSTPKNAFVFFENQLRNVTLTKSILSAQNNLLHGCVCAIVITETITLRHDSRVEF